MIDLHLRKFLNQITAAMLLWACCPQAAMASPYFAHFSDAARLRLQAISFLLAGLLLASGLIWHVWDWLEDRWVWLPRASFRRACGVTMLWGLLIAALLTVLSGARELLTAAVGQEQPASPAAVDGDDQRRQARRPQLERLADLLAAYAAAHDGAYPQAGAQGVVHAVLPAARWRVPGHGKLQYVYVPGLTTTDGNLPLAYEPMADRGPLWVLQADGEVKRLEMSEVIRRLEERGQ